MAKGKETNFKERIRPRLEALPNSWVVKIQQRSIRGTPDFLLCISGFFVALELKKSKDEPDDLLQNHTLDLINRAKGYAYKAFPENWNEVYECLKKLSEGKKP